MSELENNNVPNTFSSNNPSNEQGAKFQKKMRFSQHKRSRKPGFGNSPKEKSSQNGVKIIPLGGLGEIGRNMTAFEYQNEIVIIDCGVMFPDSELLGVDLLLPDFSYLKKHAKNIKALLITHGHEDHIGGVPFFMKEIPGIPIYAPRMALELIKGKLADQKINYNHKKLIAIERNKKIPLSTFFEALFMEVNHSIRDSFGIALYTPVGTIVHTGDFKVEFDSMGSSEFDIHQFAKVGAEGVLALCSDSTNVEKKIEEKTETDVAEALELILERAQGRVLVSTFASNVNRIIKLVETAVKLEKKVVIIGRSMEKNFEIATKLGYIMPHKNTIIKTQAIKNYPDNKVVIIMTGTQGENLSALTRISQSSHKIITLKPKDTIVISASIIPGNEKPISRVLNTLYDKGVKVLYSRNSNVHVSGHGSRDNLLFMLRLMKPKFFIPFHGEQRHLILHAKLAQSIGMHPAHTLVARNGDVIQVSQDQAQIVHHIHLENIVVENSVMGNFSSMIDERKKISQDGLVIVAINLSALQDNLENLCYIITKGFLLASLEKSFQKQVKDIILSIMTKQENLELSQQKVSKLMVSSIQKIIDKDYGRKPLIEVKFLNQESSFIE
jgi:ribonuclease J